ncbi:MAG: NAD(P)H-dependent oxidoreductase subunit E [Sedimentisphaerales bacterium]|nr:NAD(P)H-dependent oxidoreductase subunit E [Sedimentisphaerales bacterium]
MSSKTAEKVGAVLVVGAGVGGMQASLDLAEAGYKVYLVEKGPSIGGVMAQLDKTFPTNDCAMCTLAPRMVDCGGHLNIEKLTYSEIESIEGSAGNFKVSIRKKARSVDPDKCTGCGECVTNCLVKNIVYLDQPGRSAVEIEAGMKTKVDDILGRCSGGRETIVPILHDINEEFKWLPPEALCRMAEVKEIPIEHILRIASFYNAFSLTPKGRHVIRVCTGTACYVKGAQRILDTFGRELSVEVGGVTEDKQFSLETVNCVGCCGQSPVVTVDDDIYGYMNQTMVQDILGKYT